MRVGLRGIDQGSCEGQVPRLWWWVEDEVVFDDI